MKKLFLLICICSLLLFGCNKKEEEKTKNIDGVKVEEIGVVKSDFGEDCLLLKATNNSDKPVTVFTTVSLLDTFKKELEKETGLINLYSNQSNYYIVEISSDIKYASYKLKNESVLNLYNDYKDIYNSVIVEQTTSEDKETIKFKVTNNSNKEIDSKILGMFYKDNKVIAASVGECEKVSPKGTCEDTVYIPVNSLDDYTSISYDKVELLLMEINYPN